MLREKKILLGVTGSIAAYKAAHLVRLLVKEGALVKVIMSPSAHDFITPLTLSTLSKSETLTSFVAGENGSWNNHVELGLWADAFVIAPASANTLAKMANGLCDNLLLATYLSARCPVFFCPAMDLDMLQHPSTQANISKLKTFGNRLIEPGFGALASGLIGLGRMAEPEIIVRQLNTFFVGRLQGKKALVTAGPTHEAIDPVRFIGNNSSGKMGFAIAEFLADEGAAVTLVSGPTHLHTSHSNIILQRITSAEEMHNACVQHFADAHITVLSAAVADYKPLEVATQKIKKTEADLQLNLTKTHDIAAALAQKKQAGQIIVGFALETENERANAEKKLFGKNFDLIVLNSLNDNGAGFGHDTNKVTLIDNRKQVKEFPLKPKKEVARDIVEAVIDLIHA